MSQRSASPSRRRSCSSGGCPVLRCRQISSTTLSPSLRKRAATGSAPPRSRRQARKPCIRTASAQANGEDAGEDNPVNDQWIVRSTSRHWGELSQLAARVRWVAELVEPVGYPMPEETPASEESRDETQSRTGRVLAVQTGWKPKQKMKCRNAT